MISFWLENGFESEFYMKTLLTANTQSSNCFGEMSHIKVYMNHPMHGLHIQPMQDDPQTLRRISVAVYPGVPGVSL
jgi:hypothetical protein